MEMILSFHSEARELGEPKAGAFRCPQANPGHMRQAAYNRRLIVHFAEDAAEYPNREATGLRPERGADAASGRGEG